MVCEECASIIQQFTAQQSAESHCGVFLPSSIGATMWRPIYSFLISPFHSSSGPRLHLHLVEGLRVFG